MDGQAYLNLLNTLGLDASELAARLGGRAEDYEKLKQRRTLPFPVWDALQRMAHREGYAWNAELRSWRKAQAGAALVR